MAGRIRSLKPELLEDSKAGQLSDGAWRLWVSSFLLADDYGNFRAHPAQLCGQVFWGSPRTAESVGELLRELAEVRLLLLYQVNGQLFANIPGWTKHQRVDNAGKPRCPKPEEGEPFRGEPPRVSANLRDSPPDPDHRPPNRTTDHDPLATRSRRAPSGDHQTFVARFDELYAAKNGGARPTWGAKQGKQVSEMLKRPGGLSEALKRVENMFAAPPPWPPPPHDLGTLVQHYDRFAQPHGRSPKTGHYQHTGDEEYAGGEVDL